MQMGIEKTHRKKSRMVNHWQKYESEKRHIDLTSQSSEEYDRRIRELTERMKV